MTRPVAEVLASLGSPDLLVVGDLMLDRYLTGVVDRISPEAPIQVLRVESETVRLGGAGSVAVDCAVLGARTRLVGVLGEDAAAEQALALARGHGIEVDAVRDPARRTGVKTRHLARANGLPQQILRVDQETVAPLAPEAEARLLERLEGPLREAQAVLVSDYAKGVLTERVLARLFEAGRRRGVPVLVDPKGDRFEAYRGASAIKPNRAEARQATGLALQGPEGAARAAEALVRDLGLDFALVTLDADGMVLAQAGREPLHLPAQARVVFDATGAGDMTLAALATALASGADPEEAAALASVAAGLEVERVGAVPLTRAEIAGRVGSGAHAAKRTDLEDAAALVARERAAGRRVVFTNGCFDVLHAGHVHFLRSAKALGDLLVVGLNSDASVRRLKGEGRPVIPEADRVEILSALSVVDRVVVFEEDTPIRLLEALRPDLLVKGSDYRDREVVGRGLVESQGGRVVLVELLPGRSTTATVARIRAAAP